MTSFISIAVLAFVVASLSLTGVRLIRDRDQRTVWKNVARSATRPTHLATALAALIVLVPFGGIAYYLSPDWLRWSWWQSIGGSGNIVFGSSDIVDGTIFAFVPVLCVAAFAVTIPTLAWGEENDFRWARPGTRWHWAIIRSIAFGLVHAIVGAPIIICLTTLTGAGLLYEIVHYRAYIKARDYMFDTADKMAGIHTQNQRIRNELIAGLRYASGDHTVINDTFNLNMKDVFKLDDSLRQTALIASAGVHAAWNWIVITIMASAITTITLTT